MPSKKEWPDSVINEIAEVMKYNAPLRTISTLIPIDSIKFGKDCIELHNAIIRKLYNSPKMKLGDRIVGTSTSTHQILKKQGLAGDLKTFAFVTDTGGIASGNATAYKLKESVGEYIKKHYGGSGVSIYGLSAMDGYHSMLLTYRLVNSKPEFVLIDQGPATSFLTGRSESYTSAALDKELSEYVRDRQGKRVGKDNKFQYPANIEIYKIYPGNPK